MLSEMWAFTTFGKGNICVMSCLVSSFFLRAAELCLFRRARRIHCFCECDSWKMLDLIISSPTSSLVHSTRLTWQSDFNPTFLPGFSFHSFGGSQEEGRHLNSKVQTDYLFISDSGVRSFSSVTWESDSQHGDSMSALLSKLKPWCAVPFLTLPCWVV